MQMSAEQESRPAAPPTPVKLYDSEALFAGAREILIAHEGETYRLRRTAKGGLILTK